MEPTNYAHLSWDAFQRTRSLALDRMRPDHELPDPEPLEPPPSASAAAVAAATPATVAGADEPTHLTRRS